MKRTKHGQHLHKLTRLGFLNCFLVEEEDGLTLVDTGLPGAAAALVAAAEEVGGEIRRIAITHAHGDHVGSLAAVRRRLPGAEVLVSERDARFMRGDKSLDADEPQAKPRGGLPKVDVEPTRLLKPGDRVGSLEVMATPGHTPGHVAFFDTRDGTAIAGDAYHTIGTTAVSGKLVLRFPFPTFATWHKPTALASARALRERDPARLAVGHGPVIETPGADMDRAISEAS